MIPIVGDMHVGARSGNKLYHEYFSLWLKDFFQFVDDNDIREFIQLGDMFDVRKHVDTWCLSWFKEKFVKECVDRKLLVHVIIGNHDIHYRESLEVNTPNLVLSEWSDTFNVIDKPTEVAIDGKTFLLVPWIAKSNKEDVEKAIKKSKASYLCGHFEFNGFPMHKGSVAKTKHDHVSYGKFKKIFSGHFHTKSEKDNVIYTGTPYETTWIDANDEKGFYVIGEDTIRFEPNSHTFHEFIRFPEVRDVSKKFIRGIIEDLSDKKAIENWKEKLLAFNPHDIKFQEKTQVTYASSVNMDKIKSTEEFIFDFIDETETNLDKDRLKNIMSGIYQAVMGDDNA
jgi:DNA repair exonuclease SbcCD nuclease subunit